MSISGLSAAAAPLPPLDWTLAHLTGVWASDGAMILCPLPGHKEDTPSFNLWSPDDNGVPQRFGCFGCGRKGDVVDLIAAIEGISVARAMERAAELADKERDDSYERARTGTVKFAARPLDEVYTEIVDGMTQREFDVFVEFMHTKFHSGEALEQYAMNEWGVSAVGNQIVIPHRDPDGTITGIKYRAGDKKWNEVGSRFPHLYGSWRDVDRRPRVVLCEGESDTLWAAWSLRDDENFVALGMPSGASQNIDDAWVEQLKDREVYLMLDMDDAGVDAAKRWVVRIPDARIGRLPQGEDLLSCGTPVKELIDVTDSRRRSLGMIAIDRDIFVKSTPNGPAPVADFSFDPKRELKTDNDGSAWEVQIRGSSKPVVIRASDFHSGATITRWANKHGRAWVGGSGPAVQGVFNWVNAGSSFLPLVRATEKAGKIGRSFVGPNDLCVGADRLKYIAPALGDARLESKIKVEPGEWDSVAILALERLNDPAVMATVLGWLCSSLLRGKRPPAPPLFVSGESGSGKTNMLSTVLGAFGFNTETNLTTTTPFGVDCMVSSSIGFPIWFDEYRHGAREDSLQRLRQLLRDAYYGQPSMKGGMKQQATELTEVTTWAGIVVSGEMSSHETSHRDRMVMIDLDPDARNREAYVWLQDDTRTAGLGYALLEFLAARSPSLFRVEPAGDVDLPDRFRETLGFVQAGWDAWKEFRWKVGNLHDSPAGPDLSMLAHGRRENEDPWLEAIKACEGMDLRGTADHIVRQTDEGVQLVPSEVIVEAKRVGIELPARANELIQWLRRRYPVVDKRIGSRRGKLAVGMKLDETM